MAESMNFITREWLLSELPLRQVERGINRALRDQGFAPILEGVLRKGYSPAENVGIVDVDVELGKFFVHEMDKGAYYVEAVYTGEIDADVKLRRPEDLPYAGYKTKSFMLDIEARAEIDVQNKKVISFEITDSEIF